MESWWWQARRTLNRAQHGDGLTDPEVFNRLAAGYATRAESLSLFGSYPLHEARQLVAGLFGVNADTTSLEACYAGRTLRLAPRARITDGLYFYQGQVRTTRRVVSGQGKGYLDLHPAEEVLVSLLDGRHTLTDLNRVSRELQPWMTGTACLYAMELTCWSNSMASERSRSPWTHRGLGSISEGLLCLSSDSA